MQSIPHTYEIVALEAHRLIVHMAVAPSMEMVNYYWEAYLNLLSSNGWTDTSFDAETLKRINATWR